MKNKKYEEKLHNEILVDCEDDYDQNRSWFYYVQDELDFPFVASIKVRKKSGGEIMKKVKALEFSTADANFDRNFDIKIAIEFDEYIIEIPMSKLQDIEANEGTIDTIETWKYWINK